MNSFESIHPRNKVLEKIKKFLALSASSNEHEAAAALRQAQKLMEMHNITELEIEAFSAEECHVKSSASKRPASWETTLAQLVANGFGCELLFSGGGFGYWVFIGCNPSHSVAQYAFTVLYRQLKRARAVYIKEKLGRCKKVTKVRRADLFCDGWVRSAASTLNTFVTSDKQSSAIQAYVKNHYPQLSELNSQNRNDGRNLSDREYGDLVSGMRSGRDAKLNHGVGGMAQHGLLN